MASVVDLPVELLLVLFNLLQPRDVAHVLATCRALRAHALTDSVWRDLAARYGVHDIAHVPEPYHSFRAVYTRLLHSYGPLLGLWASDAPFENAVFRLRWDPGSGMVSAGIIGELFLLRPLPGFGGVPEDAEVEPEDFDLRVPRPPRHVPVLKIGFDAPGESPNVDSANADAYELSPGRTICSFNTPHITSLVGLHAPERRIFLNIPDFVRSPLSHPIYPGANPWLDLSRASHKSTFAGVEVLTGEPPGAPTAAEIVQATKALGELNVLLSTHAGS